MATFCGRKIALPILSKINRFFGKHGLNTLEQASAWHSHAVVLNQQGDLR